MRITGRVVIVDVESAEEVTYEAHRFGGAVFTVVAVSRVDADAEEVARDLFIHSLYVRDYLVGVI